MVAARELDDDSLVVVGVPDEGREEAVSTTIGLLAVAVPLLIALVAVVCAVVVGRALRPVERMRAEAEAVTSSALDRRIAAPGSGDEVDRLAHTLNRMLDRLQSGQERQRRFVSDASHELRSPSRRCARPRRWRSRTRTGSTPPGWRGRSRRSRCGSAG